MTTGTADPDAPTTDPAAPPPAEPKPTADAEPKLDASAIQKELREARAEAARSRTALKRYEDAEKAAKDAQMGEVEKLQARIAELEREKTGLSDQLKATDLKSAVQRAASKLGFADPDDAMRLLDPAEIEYSDDGRPRNLDHLLGDLVRTKPYLKSSFTQPPDLGQGDRGTSPGTLTRAALEKMTEAQVMALPPAEVDAALARP